jgi:hypothetical protein
MPARGRLGSGSSPEHMPYSGLVPEPSAFWRHRTARAARPMFFHFNSDLKKAFV